MGGAGNNARVSLNKQEKLYGIGPSLAFLQKKDPPSAGLKAFCLFKHLPLGDLTVISHRFLKMR